ncbi:MAG: sorbosone dehydrogenase family protein [Pseudomonadota bacterium]
MSFTSLYARVVAMIGGAMILMRRWGKDTDPPAIGGAPQIPDASPQNIPTLKMPTARGWKEGELPVVASGLSVNAFATGLLHPRWIYVLPNNDVLVAEALPEAAPVKTPFDFAITSTMKRAAALGVSANRISLLRDNNGNGTADSRVNFIDEQRQPFGMALVGDKFYVGNTDGVVAFDYQPGADRLQGTGQRIVDFKPGGHWTRSLLVSPDGQKLYAGVGSLSNIAEHGFDAEEGRAAIYEIDLQTGQSRVFAAGLRTPVGMAWEPVTGKLWTVVNERDGLGDEVPPDYLTSVKEGGFYGWPYCYWGQTIDDRVAQDPAMVATAIKPDYALGGHTASLGLCWMPAGTLAGFDSDGMVIGQHGSWNRSNLSGYRVIFVPFRNGLPAGPPRDILSGFLSENEKFSYGRPVGVTIGPGPSLLVADDVGNVIWRVVSAGG